ncbi:efflux RND transporter periplasmic adaptor subunit [Arenibaculum pallidiluteum]|uniref:efflux RND transporter periplasmic adaptor subunit n=1 Tax=Arenibaculum pallidiluteum TaxID=2812559 RepID=UPI001A956457|nr:efflux RND transporter periplasmic adaptor subunit [Arenibaculum pallidiluteum]
MLTRLLATAIIGGALAFGGWWYGGVHADQGPAHTTVAVKRGSVERSVTAVGKIEPLQFVDVGTQVSGQLRKIHVQPGNVVATGDLLAEIDPTVYVTRVESDRANLLGLEAQLAERRATLKLAQQQLQRQGELLKANATSRELYDSSATEVEVARARIGALEAEIGKARSSLTANEANLGYTRITAPMAGTVMSLTARQGQTLNANQQAPIILQIADLETMTIRAQVSEADVGKLRIGMDAYFTTLGDAERRWTGKLRQILPTPEVVNEVVFFNALFDVTNADRRLMPQMSAQVFFVLDRAADALVVPVGVLKGRRGPGGRQTVEVLKDGVVETRTVTVGVQDRVSAQILSGLEEGEQVVVGRGGPGGRNGAAGPGGTPRS